MDKIELFVSYAPEDETLREELYTYLIPLQRNRPVSFWSPRDIIPGKETAEQIRSHLNAAHIILLLISAHYLSSDDIYRQQVLPAMERARTGQATIIPVLLRAIDWEDEPFGKLPVLPTNRVPVMLWNQKDEAWRNVVQGIRKAIDALTRPAPNEANAGASTPAAIQGGTPAMATSSSPKFDVFLCYNNQDREAVKAIGSQLKAHGIKPWLDVWEMRPGLPWQRALEEQIENINSAAVFVGKGRTDASGKTTALAPWQQMEVEAFLRKFVNSNTPVIPVILQDAPEKPKLPLFLEGMHWVDFRKSDPNPLNQLIWGITGISNTDNAAQPIPPSRPAATVQTGLTPWERKVRQERLDMLQEERKVVAERIRRVRETWRYETNEAVKMQQEHQMKQDEAHLKQLDDEINQLIRELQ